MISAYRQALKDMHADTHKGPWKATTAATVNQEAFRRFVVEQPNAFRDTARSWSQWGGMEQGMNILAQY
jgi:hypothetical protein